MATPPASAEFMVAAIDIGTSYSGYAFSYKDEHRRDPLNIHLHPWHGKETSSKTSSVILLNPDKSFNSFGFEAENKFAEMAEDGMALSELEQFYYVDSFKMRLYKEKVDNISRDIQVDDIFGKPISVMYLIEKAIEYFKSHLVDKLTYRGMETRITDVRWVLTIPAVWTDQAKQVMRECAIQAGIPKEHLTLAFEPEAAALYCKQLPPEQISGSRDNIFKPGSRTMVVDLGGGTADITVQEITADKRMRSVFSVSGGPWGGSKVNAEFIGFLIEIFGNEVIRRLQKNDPADYLEIIREFEMKKRYKSTHTKGDIVIRLPLSLQETYTKFNEWDFQNAVRRATADVSLKKDKMHITVSKFNSFFERSIGNIVQHMKTLQEEMPAPVSAILMVGGFSECPLVNEAVKNAFPSVHVVTPIDCDLSVLKGAVLYGHRPEAITARYCNYSVGISINKPYNPTEHVKADTFLSGNMLKCGNCFEKFYSQGDIIEVGETRSVNVHSDHRTGDRQMWKYDVKEIDIFTSPSARPMFVTDPGCRQHATITIDPPEGGWPDVVDGRVEMKAGGTELIVRYIDQRSGKVTKTTVDSFKCLGE